MELVEIKNGLDAMNRAWNEFKSENDAKRGASEEKLNRIEAAISAQESKFDAIETKLNRTVAPAPEVENNTLAVQQKAAFNKLARTGEVTPEERKALYVADNTTGGHLALPSDMEREIIKNVVEMSPVRAYARVRSTGSGQPFMQPKRSGTFSAAWTTEHGTRAETTGLTYGMEQIPTHEMYALVDISVHNLEDSAYNLEAELNSEFTEQFGVAEGSAFVSGTGVGKPEGITQAITATNSGSNGDFDADDLIDLLYGLKDAYWANARWCLKRTTMKKIRKLKDSGGQYLWVPAVAGANSSLASGVPATILDKPYFFADGMSATGTTGNKSVVVGDFSRYVVVDRVGIQIQRDPYTQNTAGIVRFIARKRVGGQVIQTEAFAVLQESA